MTSSNSFRRFAFAFGTAFAVVYVLAVVQNLTLITVYPTLGIVVLGMQHAQDAAPSMGGVPAMHWYGWTATAALGAFMLGLIAAFSPERLTRWIWMGWVWVAPVSAMIACVCLTMPWLHL